MKAADFSQVTLDALRVRIQSQAVVEAFDRLVEYGLECHTLECAPGSRGKVLDFRYISVDPRGWPFAFTVSRAHLLFYIRPLGLRTLRLTKTLLARRLEVVRKRADADIQIVIRSRQEADAVVAHLLSRWPAVRSSIDNGSQFRESVERIEGACRVTGVMDRRHLRAVPIKTWEACDKAERSDGHNGLLLSPHVAHLFERGYVSFADDGQLLVARQLNSTVLKRWAILLPIAVRSLVAKQKPYMAWHRQHVFEKAEAGRRRKG
jgi:hypothetical protein